MKAKTKKRPPASGYESKFLKRGLPLDVVKLVETAETGTTSQLPAKETVVVSVRWVVNGEWVSEGIGEACARRVMRRVRAGSMNGTLTLRYANTEPFVYAVGPYAEVGR